MIGVKGSSSGLCNSGCWVKIPNIITRMIIEPLFKLYQLKGLSEEVQNDKEHKQDQIQNTTWRSSATAGIHAPDKAGSALVHWEVLSCSRSGTVFR